MSRVVNKTETLTFIPTGYSDITFTSSYYQNPNNGLTGSNSTTYAVFAMRNTSYHIYYDFSVSGIPSNATITSISCSVKGYVSDSSYYPSVRLYSGTTAKGSASNITSTSSSNVTTLNVGTWTISELENARLYIAVASRSNSASTSSRYFRFYGATLNISYSINTTEYEITTTVQSGSVTFSPTSQYVESGLDGVVTINNLSDIATFSLTDNGNNVVSELVHISGNTYTYTIENISADHALIARTVPAYNVTVTNNSTNLTYLNPASGTVSRAGQGSDFEVKFIPTDINYINIYDNNVLVDKSVLTTERPIVEDFTTFIPTSYSGNTFTGNNLNLDRGLTGTSSTTYATLTANNTNTDYVVYYQFDVSTIPQNAVINSVSCNIRIRVSNSFSSTNTGVELYSGNTSKSNRNYTWYNSTTATTYPLANIQSFTREELDDVQIKITGRSSNSGRSIYFYGADLTVEYEYEGNIYYIYSAQNIQSARTIRFEDKVKYNITGTSNLSGASISPSSGQAYDGTDYTVNLLGLPSSNAYKLYDNDVDVTSSVVPPPSNTYEITTQVSGASYGFVLNGSGYYESNNKGHGNSAAVCRVNFNFESAAEVTIQYINYAESPNYDYGIFGNIDSTLGTTYTADNASLIYKSCAAAADNSADARTLVYEIPAGSHFIDIKFRKDSATDSYNDSLQWKILSVESSGSNNYTYTITNVSAAHTLRLEENTYYSVTGTSSFTGASLSGLSNKVYGGDSITITLNGIPSPYSFTLKDNNVDVTSSIVGELSNAYQITERVSAATYGFELNDNGYYESTNQGIGSSAAVCRVNFNCSIPYEVTIQYINYAESPNYDYGIFGNVDSALGTTYTADANTFKTCSAAADNSPNPQTLVYTIPAGSHFIDIKFRKDSATDSYNDSLQWKILDIGPASGVTYTYTINNVLGNHTLVLSEKTKYSVTATSSYPGITVSVSNSTPYGGESSTITVNNVSDISLISIFDNGVTAITGRFSQSGTTLTYTFENISTNHSITVVEHVYYNLSITNDTTNSTVTPTGTISNIDAGESYTIILETPDISIIQVTDNDINKTEDLVHISAQSDTIVLYINSSSNASSSGYTNFTTSTSYPISNAGDASSDTGNYFRLRSTTNSGQHEVWLNFNTSDLSDIPSNANLSVTCKVAFRVSSTTYISALAVQLYSGNTAKGTATTTRTTTTTAYTLNIGNWTLEELQNARIRVTATHDASTNNGDVRIYGADLTINYSIPEHYEYTLTDISGNHTIVFLEGAAFTMYSKNNNTWVQVSKVYKKINGIWVEMMNANTIFEPNKIYMRK